MSCVKAVSEVTIGPDALFEAARSGRVEVIAAYLDADGDVNIRDKNGTSLLQHALASDHPALIERVLREGPDWTVCDQYGKSVFDYARTLRALKLLTAFGAVVPERYDTFCVPPLFNAVIEQDYQWLNALLHVGCDPNIVDGYGRTPLFYAASKGDTKAIGILLAYGANVNQRDSEMTRALDVACINRHFDAARMLIDAGAAVDWPDHDGNSLSHFAAKTGRADILDFVALNGADLNRQNKEGNAPIHIAVLHHHPQAVATLLSHGASAGIRNNDGCNALDIAITHRQIKIIEIIIEHCGITTDNVELLKTLLEQHEWKPPIERI